ncbi:hypothetical protein SAMN05421858_3126 [Haladaptatus litoreus]|uniref:DNA recombination and repair protein Rad51-like C-terminal domain-containing protein n=2 Tax=Haladaptatus litoreus TaxID=553468 RepID=A0A1N7CN93_9EURY|nr:hypothetical protein SAMN05421858_3126 [Haladaptatus litoreus]
MRHAQPELPTIDSGITLLETDERATGALQSLVLDQILLEGGSAIWMDANGHGTTEQLSRIAPSMRALDRIRIARAFTPWQHQSLCQDLAPEITEETAVAVLPAFDWFYRSEDLPRGNGERMLTAAVDLVSEIAETYDIPVLVTQHTDDELTAPIRERADDVIRCKQTPYGPRFTGDEYETLVYPLDNGMMQTTLAFWKRVLTTRHPAVAGADSPTEVSVHGSY